MKKKKIIKVTLPSTFIRHSLTSISPSWEEKRKKREREREREREGGREREMGDIKKKY